ncbi:DUF1428 domain-containing protein [Mesorhizobium microcysteis]|uniref:DUF1428 domain-containing protein n=1 Tax=Neoaquamicrobium microcysteis TaxID=2682781 RepID=A0A5D4GS46_9HYPH|nr:DUF1428 domain-containing protein [Mesorhizobium microcysteis]TYR30559.1 DUF1428 domain-containing protein [Mesorhizobium microcysteis]
MSYIDGMVAAVPTANKAEYLKHAAETSALFKEHGATACVEAWGNEVPRGEVTDFHRSVQAKEDETIVLSWIMWPSKAVRDDAWEKLMQDERMMSMDMPFDGKRMIYGGFDILVDG